MEANVLRLILLILGVAFVVGIYLWERRKRDERHVHAVRREPEMPEQSLQEEVPESQPTIGSDIEVDFDLMEEGVRLRPSRSRGSNDATPPVVGNIEEIDFDRVEEGVRLRPSRPRGPNETSPPPKTQAPAVNLGNAVSQVPDERIPVPVWALKKPATDELAQELSQLDALVRESAPPRRSEATTKERIDPTWTDVDVTPKGKMAPVWSDADVVLKERTAPPSIDEVSALAPKASEDKAPVSGEQIAFPFVAEVSKKLKGKKKDKEKTKDKEKAKDKDRQPPPLESEPPEFPTPILPQTPPKILVINVVAKRAPFKGEAIMSAAADCGMHVGDMNIFHFHDLTNGGKSLFSMASMVEPGRFPVDHMSDFTTPGVSLFTQIPGPKEGLALYNQMLNVAEQLAKRLGGDMQDETHSVLTRQTIEHMRGEIIEYQRKQRLVRRPA